MWPLCTANSLLWLLLPFLIGLITGWWVWARKSARAPQADRRLDISASQSWPQAAPAAAGDVGASAASLAKPTLRAVNNEPAPKAPADESASPAAAAPATAIGIPTAVGDPDDLRQIKGVGPKLNDLLQSLGVRRFDQIAAWGRDEIAKVDSHLGAFSGRIERDNWVEQAKLLARGAFDEFNTRFGGSGPTAA